MFIFEFYFGKNNFKAGEFKALSSFTPSIINTYLGYKLETKMQNLVSRLINNHIFDSSKPIEILLIGDSFPSLKFSSYLEIDDRSSNLPLRVYA